MERRSTRELARSALWRVAPAYMADRAVRYEQGFRDRVGATALAERFVAEFGREIRHGPFAGMLYPSDGDAAVAKYLGCYELEIRDWIESAVESKPPHVINIGAADGYYAVGFKRVSPASSVTAFELSSRARAACARTAARNECDIALNGIATRRRIATLPASNGLVLCDCEGAEMDLLTPEVVDHLSDATVLVELHEGNRPGVTDTILCRFGATHDVEVRELRSDRGDVPAELADWSPEEIEVALSEHRGIELRWARFTPKH